MILETEELISTMRAAKHCFECTSMLIILCLLHAELHLPTAFRLSGMQ